MKKFSKIIAPAIVATMVLAGCTGVSTASDNSKVESAVSGELIGIAAEGVQIVLSDEGITVDGVAISEKETDAVHTGADIIYYEEGKDELYGEGDKDDEHSKEEADKHTVVTITKPGTYTVSGSLSYGQIVVDLGKDADKDAAAVVNLVLNGTEINCDVASAIVVMNAYECGDDDEDNATPTVDTSAAGFNLILAKDSVNIINGSHVAKIYKDGTTKEDVENDEAKKKYKFDGAINSLVSFNIDAQENGKLIVNADNEGISGALHLTINGGEITINSSDDAINTNEDNVSVLTINGGVVICDSGLGEEGDGIDSNGYITMNDGYVIACANAKSQDSGVDSDLGIYTNGGTLLASGNMYDEIEKNSEQLFMVLNFREKITEDELIMVADAEDTPIFAFSAVNDYTVAAYSSPELAEGTYHLYKVSSVTGDLNGSIYTNITDYTDAVQLQTSGGFMMGGPGMGGGRGPMPGGDVPAMADGERPRMPDGEMPQTPEDFDPEHFKDRMPDGERPEGGKDFRGSQMQGEATTEFEFSKESYQFGGISEK